MTMSSVRGLRSALTALLGLGVLYPAAASAQAAGTPSSAAATADSAVSSVLGAGGPRVTLDEAISRALERSPALAQSEQAVANASSSVRTSWGAFLPSISASSGASLRSANRFDAATDRVVTGSSDSYNAGLSMRYEVFAGGRKFADLNQGRANVTAAEARKTDQQYQVVLQTRTLFVQALEQGDLLGVAQARVDQAQESLDMTRRQARVGLATTSDTLRARLELVNARQAELKAETATRAARFALGHQVGEAGPVTPVAPEGLEPKPLAMRDEEILAAAEQASPSVRAATASVGAAGAALTAAKTQYLPSLSFSSGYNWANQAASFGNGNTSWSLGLSASYPIFNGFQREVAVSRASEARDVARLQEEDARLAARQQADAAVHTLRTAELAISNAQEALSVAQEDLRVVQERYRVGVATILDVVTSEVSLDQARVDLVTSRYDYVIARAQLEAILGRTL